MKLVRTVARTLTMKARSRSPRSRKHSRKRSLSPPSRTPSTPSTSATPGTPSPRSPLQRNSSQVRYLLTQRISDATAKANLEALEAMDRRCQNDALFGSIGRAHPHLLAPLHYFAEAQAGMASLRGVQAGMRQYQVRNQELLYRTAMHPKIVGLDGWLVHLCSEKLGADGRIGPANVDDINRMFLELQEALNLCDELDPQQLVNVACDNATYTDDPLVKRARSFDLDVRDRHGKVARQIEVTSCGRPVQRPSDLRKALNHLVHKMCDGLPGAKHEGAIALTWDACRPPNPAQREFGPQPFDVGLFLQAMVRKLEQQGAASGQVDDAYAGAGSALDRITLFSNDPADPQVFAVLTRDGPSWHAEIGPFQPHAA